MLVAITGNFASGKTSLSGFFREAGFKVISADSVVADIYSAGTVSKKLEKEFRTADKKEISEKVFDCREKLAKLNSIIHPVVEKKISELQHSGKIVFVEVPLLFESNMDSLFDKIILITSDSEESLSRAKSRGFTEKDFKKRRSFQQPFSENREKPDFIVDNSGSIKELKAYAQLISNELLKNITNPRSKIKQK